MKNRSFVNQSLTRKLQVTQKELLHDSSPARFFKLLNFSNYDRTWILFCCPLTMDRTIHCFETFMDKPVIKPDSAVWKGNSRGIDFQSHPFVFLRWNGTLYLDQKVSFNLVKKRSIVCYCTHEQKMNFEGFAQNCCHGNQPRPFEVVFYSIDANTACFLQNKIWLSSKHIM